MRGLRAIPLILFGLALPCRGQRPHPPPVQPATSFAAVEVHANENVAIAAEPYDTRRKKNPSFASIISATACMPVRLIVTNNGDRPISLRDARILFMTAEGDNIQTAQPEDVERLMTRKEREGAKLPLPAPLPDIKLKPKASNKAIEKDFNAFEYHSLVVEPHTTRTGFLFYDVSDLDHPLRGRQAAPARGARRRRQRALLLRDSFRQVPASQNPAR